MKSFISWIGGKNTNKLNAIDYIDKINERLSSTIIENLDFEKVIKRYDSEDTLFYLDPPYFQAESYYKNIEFNTEDHTRLRDILKSISGKFILSYNNCSQIKELYKDFNIEGIERHSNLVSKYDNKDKTYKEIIIKNY